VDRGLRPQHDLPLATLNVKDFEDFAEHEGLTLITQ
jgi:predicted nucleic acid-binding protein